MTINKVFLFGLDNSGKTSIVNAINKIPDPGNTIPTLSFNINKFVISETEFVIWDAPGQILYRENWGKGRTDARILCFVLDILAPDRYNEAKEELDKVMNADDTKNVPLVICFHKLDIPDAKKSLPKAKDMFGEDQFKDHIVKSIETTIFNPDSILKLKDVFVEALLES